AMALAHQKILVTRNDDRGGRRKAENDARIRAHRPPDLPLVAHADAMHTTLEAEMVGDHLEMQVRRPVAVFLGRTKSREGFASGNLLTQRELLDAPAGEMPIERPEDIALIGAMFEKNRRAEAEGDGIVIDEGDLPGEGRMHRLVRRR